MMVNDDIVHEGARRLRRHRRATTTTTATEKTRAATATATATETAETRRRDAAHQYGEHRVGGADAPTSPLSPLLVVAAVVVVRARARIESATSGAQLSGFVAERYVEMFAGALVGADDPVVTQRPLLRKRSRGQCLASSWPAACTPGLTPRMASWARSSGRKAEIRSMARGGIPDGRAVTMSTRHEVSSECETSFLVNCNARKSSSSIALRACCCEIASDSSGPVRAIGVCLAACQHNA